MTEVVGVLSDYSTNIDQVILVKQNSNKLPPKANPVVKGLKAKT